MSAVEIATIAQPLVAAAQVAVVWYGIRAMIGANQDRVDGAAEAARRADQRQSEDARRADQRHAEAMAALANQAAALETLIERTAPRQ